MGGGGGNWGRGHARRAVTVIRNSYLSSGAGVNTESEPAASNVRVCWRRDGVRCIDVRIILLLAVRRGAARLRASCHCKKQVTLVTIIKIGLTLCHLSHARKMCFGLARVGRAEQETLGALVGCVAADFSGARDGLACLAVFRCDDFSGCFGDVFLKGSAILLLCWCTHVQHL